MRRTILIIPALVGALGVPATALAQSDDLLGDEDYPADDYAAAPAEEYAGDDAVTDRYGDAGSYDDVGSYDVDEGTADDGSYEYADRTVDPQTFQSALSPYGRWVRTPEYGLVWIPSRSVVGADFTPYATGGTWRYSDVGWTFVSDWSWGWAPFHYGRWYRAPRWGWVWVPGSRWAPAWVDWRYGDGYIGWAPLPPRRYAAALRYHDYWFFCSVRDMWRPHVWRYRVRSTPRLFQVAVLHRRPFHHGRARWFAGPSPRVVERVIGRRVDRVRLRPNRFEQVRRIDRRRDLPRQQRVDRPRMDRQQRFGRQQELRQQRQQQVREQRIQMRQQRQQQVREQRQQQVREQRIQMRQQRQQQVREQRQQQVREHRQHQLGRERQQMRQERQQARAQRQQQVREQRMQIRQQQRHEAREQRRQPARERRRRPVD